jgi:hypothetical protein
LHGFNLVLSPSLSFLFLLVFLLFWRWVNLLCFTLVCVFLDIELVFLGNLTIQILKLVLCLALSEAKHEANWKAAKAALLLVRVLVKLLASIDGKLRNV